MHTLIRYFFLACTIRTVITQIFMRKVSKLTDLHWMEHRKTNTLLSLTTSSGYTIDIGLRSLSCTNLCDSSRSYTSVMKFCRYSSSHMVTSVICEVSLYIDNISSMEIFFRSICLVHLPCHRQKQLI